MSAFLTLLCVGLVLAIIYLVYRRIQTFMVATEIPGTPLTPATFFFGDLGLFGVMQTRREDLWIKAKFEEHNTNVYRAVVLWKSSPRFYFKNLEPWFESKKVKKDRSMIMREWLPMSMLCTPAIGQESMMWAKHRRVVAGLMQQRRLREYYPQMLKCVNSWFSKHATDDKKELGITPLMQNLMLEIFGTTMFGFDVNSQQKSAHEFEEAAGGLFFHTMIKAFIGPIYRVINRKKIKNMYDTFERVVTAALEESNGGSNACSALKTQYDFSEQEIRDEMAGLFVAGHETTANTVSWALYLLALNPEMQARAKREVQEEFPDGDFTFDKTNKNDLLLRIMHETMRVCPIIYVIGRITHQDYHYEYNGKKVLIPNKSNCVWLRVGDEYKSFDPWRESLEDIDKLSVPFYTGRRKCVGYRFAEVEAAAFLGKMLREYTIKLTDKSPKCVCAVSRKPQDLFLRIVKDPVANSI